MSLIGRTLFRLKLVASQRGYLLFLIVALLPLPNHALNRALSESEVALLEKNIATDGQNMSSAHFLVHHYFLKKQWSDLVRVAQPRQKLLTPQGAMLLVRAYLQLGEGASAQNVLGQIHGQVGPTGESKLLETRALMLMAQKEKTDIEKMNLANQAILTVRAAADLDPKNKKIYLTWVDVLRAFWPSFAQDALNVIKVMEQKTDDYESSLALKCELFTKAALWDQGAVACKRAIKARPKDVMSHYYLADVQAVKVGPEERKKILVQLGRDNPKHYEVQKALAELYYIEQNYVAAAAKYRLIAEIDATDLTAVLRLAQSEFKIKQYAAALESYKKHCKNSRMVASEFKDATKQLRSDKNLHKFYDEAMQSCR